MKLALGTVQFGMNYGVANTSGRISKDEAKSVLTQAREFGIDMLDTAISYGDSESVLGQLGVQSWEIVSKLPAIPDGCEDIVQWVKNQTTESLHRLGVPKLHGLLLHRPSQLLNSMGPALYEALQALKAKGLVNKIGISIYSHQELDALFEKYRFDLIQAPLNILDRSLVDSGWAARLKSSGVEVHTRSVFLQGLLLMPINQMPAKFTQWENIWHEWAGWLAETGLTPLQACLRYANSLEQIDRVVVGVDNTDQLDEIIQAADGRLTSLPAFKSLQDDRLTNPVKWNQL